MRNAMNAMGARATSPGPAPSALLSRVADAQEEDTRLFAFTSKEAGFESPDKLLVWRWEGDEALSETYSLQIDLATQDVNLDYLKLLGCRATFQILDEGENHWHGRITSVELTGFEADDADNAGLSYLYLRVTLEPQMALLRQDVTSRVHTLPSNTRQLSTLIRHAMRKCDLRPERVEGPDEEDQTAPYYGIFLEDDIDQWSGKDFFFQYQESTLDFLSRHLEHRGAYFWFEQYDDNEEVVFCSTNRRPHAAHPPATVQWQARNSLTPESAGRFISQLTQRHTIAPSTVVVDDYNPDKTDLILRSSVDIPQLESGAADYRNWGTVVQAGTGHLAEVDGKTLAKRNMEEQLCQRNQLRASGLVRHLHAGSWFDLEGHPRKNLNGSYIVTRIRYEGEQALPHKTEGDTESRRLWSEFTIIPANVQFRPARATPRPHIGGLLHAIVESAATTPTAGKNENSPDENSEEKWVKPYLNENGYYRIRFLFAEHATHEKPKDHPGMNSAWVRMATPYAGRSSEKHGDFGMYFPLKEQTEVLVSFIDGNPDQPIIVATVPNSSHKSLVSGENLTKNVAGFVMPGGNMLAFTNQENQNTAILSSPVADSYLVVGGDSKNEENQGILLSSRSHITVQAQTKKEIIEGNGFQRLYNLLPSDDTDNGPSTQEKFDIDWLHSESGYDIGIQKPKLNFDIGLKPTVDFSAKQSFNFSMNMSAAYGFEMSINKVYNILDYQELKKEVETKIEERKETVMSDTLKIGDRAEAVLAHRGAYGAYMDQTQSVHQVEAKTGILLSTVKELTKPGKDLADRLALDNMSAAALSTSKSSIATSLAMALLNPVIDAANVLSRLGPEPLPLPNKPDNSIKLDEVIKGKSSAPRDQDESYLALDNTGAILGSAKHVRLQGEEGGLMFSETAGLWGKKSILLSSGAPAEVNKLGTESLSAYIHVSKDNGIKMHSMNKPLFLTVDGQSSIYLDKARGINMKSTSQAKINGQLIKLGD